MSAVDIETLMREILAATPAARYAAVAALRGAPAQEAAAVTGPLLMGTTAGAKFLGVGRTTFWRMLQARLIPRLEILPGVYRVRRADLIAYVANGGKVNPQ